jgi:hypothetical protein
MRVRADRELNNLLKHRKQRKKQRKNLICPSDKRRVCIFTNRPESCDGCSYKKLLNPP